MSRVPSVEPIAPGSAAKPNVPGMGMKCQGQIGQNMSSLFKPTHLGCGFLGVEGMGPALQFRCIPKGVVAIWQDPLRQTEI